MGLRVVTLHVGLLLSKTDYVSETSKYPQWDPPGRLPVQGTKATAYTGYKNVIMS